jgi:hypothetical protein
VSRARFTRRQRLVLTAMAVAVLVVFGLLASVVVITMRQAAPPSPLPTPPEISLLPTPAAPSPTAATPLLPTPTATRAVPLSQLQSARAVRELVRIVAQARSLPPVEQIPVSFPTQHEMTIFLVQKYQQEQPQNGLTLYDTLGLIPHLDPLPLPDAAAQAANISSLYLTAGRQILLVSDRGPAGPDDELALIRTLAYALSDQEFVLDSLTPCRPTSDAALALQALVNGDALLTTALYAGLAPDAPEVERLAQLAADADAPTYAPLADNALFERLRLFSYREGESLVAALKADGQWNSVNVAYARPPCSTAQVLHPERYLAGQAVQRVALAALGPALGEGWTLQQEDTLGEFLISLHLAAHLESQATARAAADGWVGDTFALWADEQGRQLVAWRIAWDNRDEAEAFERAYILAAPRLRVPFLIAAQSPLGLPGRFWQGPAGAVYLVRDGRLVTIVWGPDAATVTAAAEVLP